MLLLRQIPSVLRGKRSGVSQFREHALAGLSRMHGWGPPVVGEIAFPEQIPSGAYERMRLLPRIFATQGLLVS